MVLKRNSVERLKAELFPTELSNQWDRLVETSYEKLPEEDIVRLQWYGMYHDKPKIGTFMMRVKIPRAYSALTACALSERFPNSSDATRASCPRGRISSFI